MIYKFVPRKSFPGWIDSPEALDILNSLEVPEADAQALRDLVTDGFTVIPKVHATELCDAVINDYARFSAERPAYVAENLDENGREKRLVNFHLWSSNEMEVVTNQRIMELLDVFFGESTSVYSSLTFKYGTQQPIHRDTPHFATWPQNRFCGVWSALEDVSPDAGPLMYIRGGHRFEVDHRQIFSDISTKYPELTPGEQALHALEIYNGRIMDVAPRHGELVVRPINKGDVVIWHAQTPHGGSLASDPCQSRWSVVAHCAPVSIQVHQHDRFFMHHSDEPPSPRYGYTESNNRSIAVSGDTAFM